jgi:DNA-binding transcriptional regulator YiaG
MSWGLPDMTPADLRAAQKKLGLTQQEFANTLKISTRQLERLLAGTRTITGHTEVTVELLLERADHAGGH